MIRRLGRAAEVVRGTPGCLDADSWIEESGDAMVATGTWQTREQCQASFAALTAANVDWEFDDRELRPRLVYGLISPPEMRLHA